MPYGSEFYIKITDRSGYVNIAPCDIKLFVNRNLQSLNYNFLFIEDIFLANEIFYSNFEDSNQIINEAMNLSDSLFFLKNYLDLNLLNLNENAFEKIISFIKRLDNLFENFQSSENIEILYNILQAISLKLDPVSSNYEIIKKYAEVVERNYLRYLDNTDTNGVFTSESLFKQNFVIWDRIASAVYSSIISGQDILIFTDSCRLAVSKISNFNLNLYGIII